INLYSYTSHEWEIKNQQGWAKRIIYLITYWKNCKISQEIHRLKVYEGSIVANWTSSPNGGAGAVKCQHVFHYHLQKPKH
uniref:Uncharacterized protein n=1 Tax=Megaselia scalaris TaxID=36166 RepID=T1H0H4_MEGSC